MVLKPQSRLTKIHPYPVIDFDSLRTFKDAAGPASFPACPIPWINSANRPLLHNNQRDQIAFEMEILWLYSHYIDFNLPIQICTAYMRDGTGVYPECLVLEQTTNRAPGRGFCACIIAVDWMSGMSGETGPFCVCVCVSSSLFLSTAQHAIGRRTTSTDGPYCKQRTCALRSDSKLNSKTSDRQYGFEVVLERPHLDGIAFWGYQINN